MVAGSIPEGSTATTRDNQGKYTLMLYSNIQIKDFCQVFEGQERQYTDQSQFNEFDGIFV